MRSKLREELSRAMKSRDTIRVSTLRLINAAIKDKDISLRNDNSFDGVSDKEILSILAKMIKQRSDSIRQYEEAGRIELAEGERAEVKVIEEFLPEVVCSNSNCEIVDKQGNTKGYISNKELQNTLSKS